MRLFPRFTEGITSLTDPAQFAAPPVVRQFFPNFIKVTGSPFPGIEVTAEYWLPDSQAVAGRLVIANRGQEARQLRHSLLLKRQSMGMEDDLYNAFVRDPKNLNEIGQIGSPAAA